MWALRTLLSGLPLAVMLGTFAQPPVLLTGGAACAAENTPDPPAAVTVPTQPATEDKPGGTPGDNAAASTDFSPAAQNTLPAPEDSPPGARPAPLPLPTPVIRSAYCPATPLPPHAQRLCAEASALLEALHAAAAALPNRRDIRMGITDFNEYTALAAELYTPLTQAEHPSADAQRITVTLLARPDAAETLQRLLRNPDALLIRRLLLDDLARTTASAPQVARQVAASAENATPGSGGTWYIAKATQPGQLTQYPPLPIPEDEARGAARQLAHNSADALAENLAAAIAALGALRLSPEGWLTPAESLATLEKAAATQRGSAAAQLLLAEAQLQAGMPQRSIGSCTAALEIAPDLGRARYIRALAHWRLQQLALAEDDLSAALEGARDAFPRTSDKVRLLRARGALRMLRNNEPGMCADLVAACALGDCEGLAAARQQQLCLTSSSQTTPTPPDAAKQDSSPKADATPDNTAAQP